MMLCVQGKECMNGLSLKEGTNIYLFVVQAWTS